LLIAVTSICIFTNLLQLVLIVLPMLVSSRKDIIESEIIRIEDILPLFLNDEYDNKPIGIILCKSKKEASRVN